MYVYYFFEFLYIVDLIILFYSNQDVPIPILILNIITLVVYVVVTTIRGNPIDIMDIIIVSALMSSANQELSQIVACNSNIRKYDFRISELENKLEELNMELKNL